MRKGTAGGIILSDSSCVSAREFLSKFGSRIHQLFNLYWKNWNNDNDSINELINQGRPDLATAFSLEMHYSKLNSRFELSVFSLRLTNMTDNTSNLSHTN